MAQIRLEILTQAKRVTKLDRKNAMLDMKNYPIGENFICPFCKYESKKNKHGSARIYENGFICFHCGEQRRIDNG